MDRGPADISFSGMLREAHHLVFISKTASKNLDMHMDELIKEQFSFSFEILDLELIF